MTPARKPKGRTLAEFEPLRPAEKLLLDACWQGEVAHIADSRPEAAHENNTVRAAFLRFLALGGDGQAPVHERGVRLRGAWIEGTLDLISANIPSDLDMVHCQFSETPLFTGTDIAGSLDFTGSRLPGFAGQGMAVSRNLICDDATFDGKENYSLLANGAVINGSVFLSNVHAIGTVTLSGTQIGGNLIFDDATFDGGKKDALIANNAVIKGSVDLEQVRATGRVCLVSVQIYGSLYCSGAKFDSKDDEDHAALVAATAVINGSVFLRNAHAIGAVILSGTQIGGYLDCTDATFDSGKDIHALSANDTIIKGSVELKQVRATSIVFLDCAQINGNLNCTGAIFDCKDNQALSLNCAQINGNLDCTGATFDCKDYLALSAGSAVIRGSVFLKNIHATSTVFFKCALIEGGLDCTGAKLDFKKSDGLAAAEAIVIKEICRLGYGVIVDEKKALMADGMTVTKTFIFQNTSSFGSISLAGVHAGRLLDNARSWGNQITLDGLTYGSIADGAPTDAATRLAWLDKQLPEHSGLNGQSAKFKPQPWKQLAKVLREMGHAEDARQVSIAFEDRLREAGLIGQAPAHWGKPRTWIYQKTCRTGHRLFGWLTGYGYRPLRLLAWMVGVWLACAGFFWYTALEGVFGPSSPLVFQHPAYADCQPPGGNWYVCRKLPEEYSGFSPLAYSLDIILPFVDLQQANSWAPLVPTPKAAWYREILALFDWKHATRLLMWFETLFGWVSPAC